MFRIPIAALAIAGALPVVAAVAPPSVGRTLVPPPGEAPVMVLRGEGAQIFECQAHPNGGYAWVFRVPDVSLSDAGAVVARHAEQRSWESTTDRSSVHGLVTGAQDVGAGNIPWLLLRAQSVGESGLFAGVTSIQRVNTAGGVAPAGGCDASHVGETVRVPMAADYYFWRRVG